MFDHDPEVLAAFAEESGARINELERGLLALENDPRTADPELLNAVFRDAHSVKAGANLLGLRNVESAAHRLENVLDLLRSGRLATAPDVCQTLLDGVDLLREILESPAQQRNLEQDKRLAALARLAD
ncbi:two-component system, chemotaxis family, sensor kinase CheA [Humidesulfovibrio mexicanus]|uniref:Two-component system, chemotaxis family, sensor kinase CheA n=1 Tax=Humidesulfovibrio mexicanus TaxID=147047 RepID=A0A238Z5Y4_9BACT|nr:Hpt domain-containing protein [Humidesulfovibrio mexicanus]SNR78796.1 two-component system, chemotaxis family, sensor kinase CheA [Humidesulfovibrio mexicanus]